MNAPTVQPFGERPPTSDPAVRSTILLCCVCGLPITSAVYMVSSDRKHQWHEGCDLRRCDGSCVIKHNDQAHA